MRIKFIFLILFVVLNLPQTAFAHMHSSEGNLTVMHTSQNDQVQGETESSFKAFMFQHGLHVVLFGGAFILVFAMYLRDQYKLKHTKPLLS